MRIAPVGMKPGGRKLSEGSLAQEVYGCTLTGIPDLPAASAGKGLRAEAASKTLRPRPA